MRNEIIYTDLFAGIGGFRLGLERCNASREEALPEDSLRSKGDKPDGKGGTRGCGSYHCVWSNEWDKYCATIYQKNFKEAPDTRDIRTIPSGEIPDHDLLCAGFPCQSFSIAGKRGGFEDTRGTLFWEICRIAKAKRPSLLLLENVKGLLSHQNGWTFATILLSLDELGYDAEWQVCNSKNYGVPQNRERVFIVGHLRGEGRFQVFPIQQGDGIPYTEKQGKQEKRQRISSTLDSRYGDLRNAGETYLSYVGAIMTKKNRKRLEDGKNFSRNFPQGQRVYSTEGIGTTLASQAGGLGAKTGLYAIDYRNRRQMELSPTILGNDHNTVHRIVDGLKIRRLTPVECERLQGFPDNWTEGVSDTQRYKMLGNAVTVNVVEAIGKQMRKVLNED